MPSSVNQRRWAEASHAPRKQLTRLLHLVENGDLVNRPDPRNYHMLFALNTARRRAVASEHL
jgi:hypothetical protein